MGCRMPLPLRASVVNFVGNTCLDGVVFVLATAGSLPYFSYRYNPMQFTTDGLEMAVNRRVVRNFVNREEAVRLARFKDSYDVEVYINADLVTFVRPYSPHQLQPQSRHHR
jgi:hypothetical protein